MLNQLFYFDRLDNVSLTTQVRQMIVNAIHEHRYPLEKPLPSSRDLATQLGVSRNTVVSAYSSLLQSGFLIAKTRAGHFINPDIYDTEILRDPLMQELSEGYHEPDWNRLFKCRPSMQKNITKPADWQDMPYPFIYGQIDPQYFPLNEWRECTRNALSVASLRSWSSDNVIADDPDLVEQIRTRLLPRRGITAKSKEILITIGSQQGLHLLASLLVDGKTTVGMEDPGYPDARNIFSLRTEKLRYLSIDQDGLMPSDKFSGCDLIYLTPSHQVPTTATMPLARRKEILERGAKENLLLIEDDYDSEINFMSNPSPAIKSFDRDGRVIYLSSLSKTLAPGLRIGYMVASQTLIEEARAMRRLELRHPPANNQRTLALFLAQGSHDALTRRLMKIYKKRWLLMVQAIKSHLSGCSPIHSNGGMAVWLKTPKKIDCLVLAKRAAEHGIVIEPGAVYFSDHSQGKNYFRLGFSVIPDEKIEPGIRLLSKVIADLLAE
ncbi:MocR-like pyridoxine biosynthesis transcription factor PdxR [Govanella unica]|uniref:PLP-dependent aminotransferase family protein n=1 Tax=Govanella unica TaxID=2975056 RepID=A0A9X3TYQ0_9PROT|nr:PLP-dependent aminotransferase family protein [Govania unica]MDA5194421.1 PLP-dependent aminotransferase family protein [Govania unica]